MHLIRNDLNGRIMKSKLKNYLIAHKQVSNGINIHGRRWSKQGINLWVMIGMKSKHGIDIAILEIKHSQVPFIAATLDFIKECVSSFRYIGIPVVISL